MPRLAAKGPTTTKRNGFRKDPSHKASDYSQPHGYVSNPDPDTRYVFVPQFGKINTGTYEADGWKVCQARPGGPRPTRGKVMPDGTMNCLDCVMMEMPEAEWQEMNLNGRSGRGGQAMIDRIERTIVTNRTGVDPMRGMHKTGMGDFYDVLNQTSGEIKERLIRKSA